MKQTLNSKSYAALSQWLKAKRLEKNLTIREFAQQLDVHHSVVGKIETGHRKVDIVEFIVFCRALDADPQEAIELISRSMAIKRLY